MDREKPRMQISLNQIEQYNAYVTLKVNVEIVDQDPNVVVSLKGVSSEKRKRHRNKRSDTAVEIIDNFTFRLKYSDARKGTFTVGYSARDTCGNMTYTDIGLELGR